MRDQVFISYSHEDERWLAKLRTHLKPFERRHKIEVWDDTHIKSGDRWRRKIEDALGAAKVAVLLVSPDYLASDFIAYHELPPLLKAAERKGLRILWVAVSASAYLETPIKDYQATNDPTRPLDSLNPSELNKELVRICRLVHEAADDEEHACDDAADDAAATADGQPVGGTSKLKHDTPTPAPAEPALQDSAARPVSKQTLERILDEKLGGVKPERKRRRRSFALVGAAVGLALLVAFAGLYLWRGRAKPPLPPLTTVEVSDEFINSVKWAVPPTGWRIEKGRGKGSLEVADQPQVGYLKDVSFADFYAVFTVTLLDDRGAAWAARVNGEGDYYLFYLSGPGGLYPNSFASYVVRGGERVPKSFQTTNVTMELKEGQSYFVRITAEGKKFTHILENNETAERNLLGEFVDEDDTYPQGGFGFLTVNREKFSVDDLFIGPPGIGVR